MEDMEIFNNFIKFIIMGILVGYLLIYGLRPSVPYPEIFLEPFEHNWLFLILILIDYYAFIWDERIGYLLLVCIISLIYDMVLFTKNINNNNKIE